MHHTLKSLQATLLLVLILLAGTLSAAIVGTTEGSFSVNQGTAGYSLKIEVPPGVAGMEPELSLNYSSGAGNGDMGLGWSIGGISSISRCPQTRAVDGSGHTFGVKYNRNDRFCIDRQRLVVVNGLRYGTDGAEYRTEIDTYAKIVQHGALAGTSSPDWFEVHTKSGLTYIYGKEDASRYYHHNGGFLWRERTFKFFWRVKSIHDAYGNTITFTYEKNDHTGYHRIKYVTYGGDNKIEFKYGSRSDIIKGYHAGYPSTIDKRLTEVIVRTGSKEVRQYKVAYTNEPKGTKTLGSGDESKPTLYYTKQPKTPRSTPWQEDPV